MLTAPWEVTGIIFTTFISHTRSPQVNHINQHSTIVSLTDEETLDHLQSHLEELTTVKNSYHLFMSGSGKPQIHFLQNNIATTWSKNLKNHCQLSDRFYRAFGALIITILRKKIGSLSNELYHILAVNLGRSMLWLILSGYLACPI